MTDEYDLHPRRGKTPHPVRSAIADADAVVDHPVVDAARAPRGGEMEMDLPPEYGRFPRFPILSAPRWPGHDDPGDGETDWPEADLYSGPDPATTFIHYPLDAAATSSSGRWVLDRWNDKMTVLRWEHTASNDYGNARPQMPEMRLAFPLTASRASLIRSAVDSITRGRLS
jgi:hypothetical protein